jgi:hypothetical protein
MPEQTFLLPPSPMEWPPEGHLAYFVLELVRELDLSAIEDAIQSKDGRGTGSGSSTATRSRASLCRCSNSASAPNGQSCASVTTCSSCIEPSGRPPRPVDRSRAAGVQREPSRDQRTADRTSNGWGARGERLRSPRTKTVTTEAVLNNCPKGNANGLLVRLRGRATAAAESFCRVAVQNPYASASRPSSFGDRSDSPIEGPATTVSRSRSSCTDAVGPTN